MKHRNFKSIKRRKVVQTVIKNFKHNNEHKYNFKHPDMLSFIGFWKNCEQQETFSRNKNLCFFLVSVQSATIAMVLLIARTIKSPESSEMMQNELIPMLTGILSGVLYSIIATSRMSFYRALIRNYWLKNKRLLNSASVPININLKLTPTQTAFRISANITTFCLLSVQIGLLIYSLLHLSGLNTIVQTIENSFRTFLELLYSVDRIRIAS